MNDLVEYLLKSSNKIKISTKDINKGDIFLALPGKTNHGQLFIDEALERGAKFVITDKSYAQTKLQKNIIIFEDPIFSLLNIAKQKRDLFKGKIIGITGSVGKTSVKENLYYFLSKSYNVSASIKSYNNFLGVLITLLNLDLLSDFSIFEMGTNDFLEIKTLTKIVKPDQTIITNIHSAHLAKLINTKNIAKEKSDIFNKEFNPFVNLVIIPNNNIDEEFILKRAINQKISSIITFGSKPNSDLMLSDIENIDDFFCKVIVIFKQKKINFIINKNQFIRINNILICLVIFLYNKINLNLFTSFTKYVPLIEGRGLNSEVIFNNKKLNFIDESYNASPHTMKMTIDYFSDIKLKNNQKKILILGEMKELGSKESELHIDLLKYVSKKKLEHVIICGKLMKIALEKTKDNKILYIMNRNLILKHIESIANENDFILVKGSNSSLTNVLAKVILNKGDF